MDFNYNKNENKSYDFTKSSIRTEETHQQAYEPETLSSYKKHDLRSFWQLIVWIWTSYFSVRGICQYAVAER